MRGCVFIIMFLVFRFKRIDEIAAGRLRRVKDEKKKTYVIGNTEWSIGRGGGSGRVKINPFPFMNIYIYIYVSIAHANLNANDVITVIAAVVARDRPSPGREYLKNFETANSYLIVYTIISTRLRTYVDPYRGRSILIWRLKY